MMKKRFAKLTSIVGLTLGALMVSESAFALSCARPDLVRSLEAAKASPKTFNILVGKFVSESSKLKGGGLKTSPNKLPSRTTDITHSLFQGVSLAAYARNDQALSNYAVDIETSCTGPWCSRVPSSEMELIAFVEERPGQSPILRIAPCPSQAFRATEEQVDKLRQCMSKRCEPEKPNRGFRR